MAGLGRRDTAWKGPAGEPSPGKFGAAGQGRAGTVRTGWQGIASKAGMARPGGAKHGAAPICMAGTARNGMAKHGSER